MNDNVMMQEGMVEKTTNPEMEVVRVYLPPPPPPVHEKAIVKITKDSIPEKKIEKKVEEKKQPEKTDTASTATTNSGGPSGSGSSDEGGSTHDVIVPSFPGGNEEFSRFLRANLHYPPAEEKQRITGMVLVSFKVNADGTISEAKVVRGLTKNCDAEALRVIQMLPRFVPARDGKTGKTITVIVQKPIIFNLKVK